MTMTTPRTAAPQTNGAKPAPPLRLTGARVKRVPWIALGVILVVAGALIFGLMVQSAGDRISVVVAARDISPGQVIEAADLRVVDAAIDGVASTVRATERSSLIGQTANSRIPAGAFVSREQFAEDAGLEAGQVVVGALLGPGGLPVPNMRVGDRVQLIETRETEQSSNASEPIGEATIYMVTAGSQSGSQFVSLVVDEDVAQRVADAASAQRLRLVLRPGEG
jgi:Flp pilus assembly protein CpaB